MFATALYERQLLPNTPTSVSPAQCTPFTLPKGGKLTLNPSSTLHFKSDVIFQPACTGSYIVTRIVNGTTENDFDSPFYASTTPLIYIVAANTVLAWVLLIITLVIPSKINRNGSDKRPKFFGGRGIISGVSARQTPSGGGPRPWLQKVAALAVSISLTIATADTFRVAQSQYSHGYLSAAQMRDDVAGSTEIRIMRVVSDVFLWLAQVQTLIRLFPRHKEKLVIKWIGFLLIVLDVIFSCLNSFLVQSAIRPRSQDAIPALSYLFQLSLSLLYGAWVLYFAITKRRFAFYNPKMPNICIIACVSVVALMVPVAFFVADVAQPDVAAWGDYFRWVGSAAGSIVVWEWVERIETLEADERNEGILGREIFEGDEMLGYIGPDGQYHSGDRPRPGDRKGGDSGHGTSSSVFAFGGLAARLARSRPTRRFVGSNKPKAKTATKKNNLVIGGEKTVSTSTDSDSSPLPTVTSPVERDNTASAISASSTVYAVHYHPPIITPPQVPPLATDPLQTNDLSPTNGRQHEHDPKTQLRSSELPKVRQENTLTRNAPAWMVAANPFKRKRTTPPIEVRNAMSSNEAAARPNMTPNESRSSLGGQNTSKLKAAMKPKSRLRVVEPAPYREPTIIPAPPRGRTWSPDAFRGDTNGASNLDSMTMTGTIPTPDIHLNSPRTPSANYPHLIHFANPATSDGRQTRGSNPERPLFLPVGSLGTQLDHQPDGEHVHRIASTGRSSPEDDLVSADENDHGPSNIHRSMQTSVSGWNQSRPTTIREDQTITGRSDDDHG